MGTNEVVFPEEEMEVTNLTSYDTKEAYAPVGAPRSWRDLEAIFTELDADSCEAHWRFDCRVAVQDTWSLQLDDRDPDADLLAQTIREAGRKVRRQSGSQLVPRRLAHDSSSALESWLIALRHNQVNCEYARGEWRVEAGVIHSLPMASALLCRNLAGRFGGGASA